MLSVRGYRVGCGAAANTLKRINASFPRLLVQALNVDVASNEKFLEMIVAQTSEAASSGSLLARKIEVDLLLRFAGTTQISEAIESAGVRRGEPFMVVVAGSERDIAGVESAVAARWERLPRKPLTDRELERVERAALLDAERA